MKEDLTNSTKHWPVDHIKKQEYLGYISNRDVQAAGTEKHPRDPCALQSRPHCLKNGDFK